MKWRWPGSKPWVQTTVGFMQTADWDEGGGNGILKFDDGALWYWSGEMAHTAFEYFPWWAVINELAPGSKAWEQITPDYWSDIEYGNEYLWETGDTGELIDGTLLSDHWLVAHDGGDRSYWFSISGDNNVSANLSVYIVSKETRSWELKVLYPHDYSGHDMTGQPVIWDGYIWFFTHNGDVMYLNRMSMDSPYTSVVVNEWPYRSYSGWDAHGVNPETELPYWLDDPATWGGEPAIGVGDGYVYWLHNISSYQRDDFDPPHPAGGMAALWRVKLPDGEWELLYYHWVPLNFEYRYAGSYNLPGGSINDRWHGPLPIGIGMVPNWWHSKIGVRDGWLYWVNNTGHFHMLSQGWTGGHAWCRLELSRVIDGLVEHDPENPAFEVLSMTTGAEDSFYNWDDTEYWGGSYKSHGGYSWRDGINSIHAFVENMWYFDDDGSIVYLHHEYPSWMMQPGDYYPHYVLSRLSPPDNLPITFNLVFEGSEMKGYGHAREVPAKTKIGTIELSGE